MLLLKLPYYSQLTVPSRFGGKVVEGLKVGMTSTILKRLDAPRRTTALIVGGLLFLGSAFQASAQSEPSASENGLEGTWRVQVKTNNCLTGVALGTPFNALLAFARGGTLSGTTSSPAFEPGQRTSDYGIWSKTIGKTYNAVSEAFILFASPPRIRPQILSIRHRFPPGLASKEEHSESHKQLRSATTSSRALRVLSFSISMASC